MEIVLVLQELQLQTEKLILVTLLIVTVAVELRVSECVTNAPSDIAIVLEK